MASWFQGGLTENLSQLTGQISTFTKEVLTEGTEEVDDHATHLKISQTRISELETLCSTQRQEYERLKHIHDETVEKLESSELQITAVSTEYRSIIHQKEEEIQRLQHAEHDLQEKVSRFSFGGLPAQQGRQRLDSEEGLYSSSPLFESSFPQNLSQHHSSVGSGSLGDYGNAGHGPGNGEIPDVQQLQQRINALETDLRSLRDSHQVELVALQDAHSQKLSLLKKRHREEVKTIKEQAAKDDGQHLAAATEDGASGGSSVAKADSTLESSGRIASLEKELQASRASLAKSEAVSADLQKANADLESKIKAQSESDASGTSPSDTRLGELEKQVAELTEERDSLVESLDELDQQNTMALQQIIADRDNLKTTNKTLQEKIDTLESSQATPATTNDDSKVVEDLKTKVMELEQYEEKHNKQVTELEALQARLNEVENVREKFESSNAEIEDLKATIENLRQTESQFILQTKEFEAAQQRVDELQNELSSSKDTNSKNEELAIQVKELEAVERSYQSTLSEVESLKKQIATLEIETSANGAAVLNTTDYEERIAELEEEVSSLEDANVKLEAELNDAQEQLETRPAQIQQVPGVQEQIIELQKQLEQTQEQNQQLQERIKGVEEEKMKFETQVATLQAEIKGNEESAEVMTSKLKSVEDEKQQLSMEKSSISEEMRQLNDKVAQYTQEIQQLHESCQKYQREAEINTAEIEQIRSSTEGNSTQQSTLVTERDDLKSQVTSLEEEKEELSTHIDELQQALLDMKHEQLEKFASEKVDLTTQIDSLTSQRDSLERELGSTESKLREQIKQQEHYIQELTKSRDLDTSGLEAEHEKLMKTSHEKDTQILNLQSTIEQKQSELDYNKEMLQSTMESQQGVNDLLSEKDKEIDSLKEENRAVSEQNDTQNSTIKEHEAELHRLTQIETQYTALTQEHRKAKSDIDTLKQRVRELETKEETEKVETATLDIITDLESEITNLREKLETIEATCTEKQSELVTLTQTLEEKTMEFEKSMKEAASAQELLQLNTQNMKEMDANVVDLNTSITQKSETIHSHESTIQSLKEEIQNLKEKMAQTSTESPSPPPLPNNESSKIEDKKRLITENGLNMTSADNGDDYINGDGDAVQIENMQRMVEEQSGELDMLKERNRELTQMLAARTSGVGVADVPKLENDMRSLRLEKEQMMQVLNDKTRECSQLKGEVHKLMSVVSAEKTALSKLQQDNQELRQGREGGEREKDSMQKEAVKNLSRIIRDKELEIESLSMKNQTLLQVLQESSVEGPQISSIVQERDNLLKQISLFQADREQIINALSSKHQECMMYHSEIQRLNTLINTDNGKSDDLQQQFESLVRQYEDKSKLLVTSQNDVITLRNENKGLKTELAEVRLKCAESDGKIRKFDRENSSLRQRCDELVTQIHSKPGNADGEIVAKVDSSITQSAPNADLNPQTEHSISRSSSSSLGNTAPSQEALSSLQSCDHESELADLRSMLLDHEQRHMENDRIVAGKESEVLKLHNQITEGHSALDEKSRQFSELSHRFHKTEQMLRTRDSEINTIRKQGEQMTFQLRGLETEVVDLRSERDQYQSRAGQLEQQVDMQKEANNKLSMALKDHAFELNAIKEKNNTLTRLMQEKNTEGEEKGEMDRLIKETETLQHQAKVFKIDADQFAMALQQQQEENRELKAQLNKVSEKENKCSREVDRLRTHLVQVEDGYTRELLEAEEREKDLRNRLAGAEDRALSASGSVDRANAHASKQVESLHQQLTQLSEQRDQLTLQLAAAQDQAAQYAAESNNLHIVLEQFQQEREQQQAAEVEHYLREVSALKDINKQLKRELHQVQMQLEETTEALEAASRLSEQLDKKEQMVSALREEVQVREHQLGNAEVQISRLSASNSAKVDKALARNLILGYFHTPAKKKHEVIDIISRALDFEGDELQQLQGEAAGGWLTGLFKKVVSTQTMPTTPTKQSAADKSFSEALVKFMERESTPEPSIRLPAEEMAAASQSSRHGAASHHSAAFNPFSTPVSDIHPYRGSAGGGGVGGASSHPFGGVGGAGSTIGGVAPHSSSGAAPLYRGGGAQTTYPLTIPGSTAGTQAQQHPFQAGYHQSSSHHPFGVTSSEAGTSTQTDPRTSSHLLMGPALTPNLPMFSMATGSDSGRELHEQTGVGSSGVGGGELRRSSTQTSTSAILKDVLQQ